MKDFPWPAVGLAFLFGVWGLSWGLPSKERAALFLTQEMQTESFYLKIEKARDETYDRIGLNAAAYYGRRVRVGESYNEAPNPLAAYSGFLIRTHHGDEQQPLVMLSRLNPFQGKWYPHAFYYGGAYLYPLAAYLKGLQILHLIKLVPRVSFYYAHPDEIGKVYLAARAGSVVALILAVIPLFYLSRRLVGREAAHAAACFFALAPACIGNAKMVKPHIWAALWMLSALYFCVRAREEHGLRFLATAAVCFGWAVGTTTSQAVFAPFLLWACLAGRQACWSTSFGETLRRMALAGVVSLAVYFAANFYIINHFQDFLDEFALYRSFYPFGFSRRTLWDFFYGALRPSFGTVLWVLSLVGAGFAIGQRQNPRIRTLALLALISATVFAVQNQSLLGSAVSSRFYLALIGMGCLFAAWFIYQLLHAPWLGWICFAVMSVTAIFYARHYASDRVPGDNASLAALWVRENVPPGSVIGQDQTVPHTFGFPPMDLTRYRVVQIGTPAFDAAKGRTFAILPLWAAPARQQLVKTGYTRVKVFAESPLQKLGFSDPFTTANFELEVYVRERL